MGIKEGLYRGIFMVNLAGIIYDTDERKVLIGRREKDPFIKELSWVFPGGRPMYGVALEDNLKDGIREKTGLNVEVGDVLYAKAYPEQKDLLSIYYYCEPVGGELRPGGKILELKWVYPDELEDYFTTSFHPKLLEKIKSLS